MQALKEALRSRLVSAGVNGGTAIFDTQAPAGQAPPYIVFQYVSGGDEPQTPVDILNEVWMVKAVSDSHATAHTLTSAIRAALHRQPLTITGWRHLWTVQVDSVWRVENATHTQLYHSGGTYRIQRHKA